jgi:hypothetical protein
MSEWARNCRETHMEPIEVHAHASNPYLRANPKVYEQEETPVCETIALGIARGTLHQICGNKMR